MKHVAMCGLDCSTCDAYIATQNDDNQLREKTARDWTKRYLADERDSEPLKAEDINCQGCLSDGPLYQNCHECEVRACGLKKGLQNCEECEEYKCDQLMELQKHFF